MVADQSSTAKLTMRKNYKNQRFIKLNAVQQKIKYAPRTLFKMTLMDVHCKLKFSQSQVCG
jgi:hypothetical protein